MDSIGVKRDGLQLHATDHTDVQLTSKLIFPNPPTSGHLLSPPAPSPGAPPPRTRAAPPPRSAGAHSHTQSVLPGQPMQAKVPTKPGLCLSSCGGHPSPAQLSQACEELPRQSGLAGTGAGTGLQAAGQGLYLEAPLQPCVSTKTAPGVAGRIAPTGSGVESAPTRPGLGCCHAQASCCVCPEPS